MEKLEKRMGIKIESVRYMMLDRFCGVDQKLTAIEQLLKKIIEPQSQTGNQLENKLNLTDKNTRAVTESGKNQDKGKKEAIGGGDGGPSHEYGLEKPLQAQILPDGDDQETDYQIQGPPEGLRRQEPSHESGPKKPLQIHGPPEGLHLGDRGRQRPSHGSEPKKLLQAQIPLDVDNQKTSYQIRGAPGGFQFSDGGRQLPPWEAGNSCGWVGLYTRNYSTNNPPNVDCSFGTDFCEPTSVGLLKTNFSKRNVGGDGRPSHESGPKRPSQALISSNGDGQETDYQIEGPPIGLHRCDGGRHGPSLESGPKKPLQAQISSDDDYQETDYPIGGPPGGLCLGGGGGLGPSHESGSKKPLLAQISSDVDDQETDHQNRGSPEGLRLGNKGRTGPPWEADSMCGWVDLYTNHCSTNNPSNPNYSFGTDFCGPAWMGLQETDFSKKNGPRFGSYDQHVNNPVDGCPETQGDRGPEGFGSKVVDSSATGNDTENGLNYSGEKGVKTGQDDIFKEGDDKPQAQAVTEGSNEGRPKTRRRKRKVNKADVTITKNSCTGSSGRTVVETGPDENYKNSFKTDQWDTKKYGTGSSISWGKVAGKTNAGGEDKNDQKTDVLPIDSSKADKLAKNDSESWGKAIQNETNFIWGSAESDKGLDWSKLVEAKTDSQLGSGAPWGKKGDFKPQAHVVTEGSNEKGHEESQKAGSWGWKEEGCGSKRKYPDSPVGGPNHSPISSGPFTAAKRRLDKLTTDEQEILSEIEPIMQSIRRILHQKGYNDGDPLSADDQAYILENVFNHHPEKAQKMGAGVDYIMVNKHMKHQGSRCFYVVSTDGRKEDFSYLKCLKNFISGKYPNKVKFFFLNSINLQPISTPQMRSKPNTSEDEEHAPFPLGYC